MHNFEIKIDISCDFITSYVDTDIFNIVGQPYNSIKFHILIHILIVIQ